MEGVWFAFDATTGPPIYQRVKVIDNVEHPNLKPGQAGRRLPGLDRRAQLLAGLVRPADELRLQRGGRDRRRCFVQQTPAQEQKRKAMLAGDVYLGPRQRRLTGSTCRAAGATTARSARSTSRPGKQVWKFKTPEPERGGVTTTASGLGFVGRRRRRAARVRREDREGALDVPDRLPDRRRAVDLLGRRQGVRRDHRRRHGDLVERRHGRGQLQVFALGGSSRPSRRRRRSRPKHPRGHRSASTASADAAHVQRPRCRRQDRPRRIVTPGRAFRSSRGIANSSNTTDVQGHVLLGGQPGAGRAGERRRLARANAHRQAGPFVYPADVTMAGAARRHGGRRRPRDGSTGRRSPPPSSRPCCVARGGISVGYASWTSRRQPGPGGDDRRHAAGSTTATGSAPPPVSLYSYVLTGKITDANGEPGQGRRRDDADERPPVLDAVSADRRERRATPRSSSRPTRGQRPGPDDRRRRGRQRRPTPRPPTDSIDFAKLKSAMLNIQLPATPARALVEVDPEPAAMPGAIYQGCSSASSAAAAA